MIFVKLYIGTEPRDRLLKIVLIRCAKYGLLHARVKEVSAQNCSAAWLRD